MFIRFFLSLTLCLFPLSILLAQIDSSNMFYKRMEGNSDSMKLQANLIQLSERISGNYTLSALDKEIKTVEVDGHIGDDNLAIINQIGKQQPVLKGVFFEDRFTGIWHPGRNEKKIELYESYPEGSIPLSIHYLRSETNLIDGDIDSPTAEIELTIVYPESTYRNDSLINQVGRIIQSHFLNLPMLLSNPDSLLILTENSFYTLYKEQNKDWHDSGNSFDWVKETSMLVTYNSNFVLCLEYLDYVYSGGAHGMSNLTYDIFNLVTGKKIGYQDIFKEDSSEELAEILTSQIRNDKQIPDSIPLTRAGYFVDKIEPAKNIYLNGSGIGFIYNQYEIAPYSSGITNIFLKYSQLVGLLNDPSLFGITF